jgi:hypothetical protein
MEEELDGREEFEIEIDGILSEYDRKSLKTFVLDFFLVFTLIDLINQEYNNLDDIKINKDIKKFNNLIQQWNYKYKNLILTFEETDFENILNIYVNEKDFDSVCETMKKMNRLISCEIFENKIIAVFEDFHEDREKELILKKKDFSLKLLYLQQDMVDPKSPEFRLSAYYALKEIDKSIDLQQYSNEFSFALKPKLIKETQYGWLSNSPETIRFTL